MCSGRCRSRFVNEFRTMFANALARLGDKIVTVELLLPVPADLAGEKDYAAFGNDAVGETLRLFPSSGMKRLVRLCHGSWSPLIDAPGRRRKR